MPGIVVEIIPEVEPSRFYTLSADIEAPGHTGGCPGCAALASHGRATKPYNDECRGRIRTIIERTLTGKARMNAHKDRIAETERVKERKRARVERGARDVLLEPRNEEQVAVRHADASGGDITENQHEEDRMRDIHVGKRGSGAASEEPLDKLRKTVRFEQVVDDDIKISALDEFYEMYGRKSRCIQEVLDCYRQEDAGNLKRSEVNELVENFDMSQRLKGKILKKVIRSS